MNEYTFINKILSSKHKAQPQDCLSETDIQKAKIYAKGKGLANYSLYRFDVGNKSGIFPFFDCSDEAPRNLQTFCDYVLFAEVLGKLHILLIELKSGDATHAYTQLDASEVFINYVTETAIRIKDDNGCHDFSEDNIILKKVVLKPMKTPRPTTRMSRKKSDIEFVPEQNHYTYRTNVFDIVHVCRVKF